MGLRTLGMLAAVRVPYFNSGVAWCGEISSWSFQLDLRLEREGAAWRFRVLSDIVQGVVKGIATPLARHIGHSRAAHGPGPNLARPRYLSIVSGHGEI